MSDLKELREMLQTIYANQVVLFKKLDNIENKLKNSSRMANIETYERELNREASKLLGQNR